MSTELETNEGKVEQNNCELDLKDLEVDSDLADFFSKKKTKKTKKKKKKAAEKGDALTNEGDKQELAKQEEAENTPKEKETEVNIDDEWNDYEEEVKDFSVLKVKNLEIEEEERSEQVEEEKEYNESGELVEPRNEDGPWNRSMSEVQEQQQVAAPKKVSKPSGKYIPPSQRRGNEQGLSSLGRRAQPQKTFKKDSFIDFPELNAAVKDQNTSNPGFQTVKKGAKQQTVTSLTNHNTSSGSTPWMSRRQREGDQQTSVTTSNQFSAFNSNSRGGRW